MRHDPFRFCVEILPQVSRTFAINIRVLDGDLHRAVLCAYLFCRIVDTAEDTEHLTPTQRIALLESFRQIFASRRYDDETLAAWIQSWGALDAANPEHQLIIGLPQVAAAFLLLPESKRIPVEACVVEMAEGMRATVVRRQDNREDLTVLESMDDVKSYCHYVAGTVGQMLTELFMGEIPSLPQSDRERLRSLGPAFALGLQMTNIIKDCHADYLRGWCYIPSELMKEHGVCAHEFFAPAYIRAAQETLNVLIRRAATYLDGALEYTLLIPRSYVRIRLFNLWSSFFAIKTLRKAWNNPALLSGQFKVKITRAQVYWTLLQTLVCVGSDKMLRSAFNRQRSKIPA
ncbi:MAG: squalene/phytoene synthase family protein [Candidatus Zixiibacteriota bacterium]